MLSTRLIIAIAIFLINLDVQEVRALSFSTPGEDALDQGIIYFNARRYKDSALYLRQAVQQRQRDPITHYYLANVLSRLNQHSQAIAEYQYSYSLDPYGIVSGYCRKALTAYRAPLTDISKTEAIASSRQERNSTSTYRDTGPLNALAVSSPKQRERLTSAVSAIRKQTESEKDRHKQLAENIAASAVNIGEAQARRVEEDARAEVNRILNPPAVLIGSGQYHPLLYSPQYAAARAEEVKRNAEERAKMIRDIAAEKSRRYKKWSEERQIQLDETAKNLESQLTTTTLPGSARLSPVGTGLFVRYYGATLGRSPYPEAHQSVVRILPSSPRLGEDSHTEEEFIETPGQIPNRSVRGSLIKDNAD